MDKNRKTLEELYDEVIVSDELKTEFLNASNTGNEQVQSFLIDHGCDASLEELETFLQEKSKDVEVPDSELGNIAGGKPAWQDVTLSVATVFGCYIQGLVSIAESPDDDPHPANCF